MATNLPSCFSIEFLEQLLKFLVNFTLLKYVMSQRSYGFLITNELIFGFQILDLKDHFSASFIVLFKQLFKIIISEVWRVRLSSSYGLPWYLAWFKQVLKNCSKMEIYTYHLFRLDDISVLCMFNGESGSKFDTLG